MAEILPQLVDIIQTNVVRLTAAYNDAGLPVPSLDDATQVPPPPQEDINQLTSLVVSAAAQLIASVTPGKSALLETAMSYNVVGSLRAVEALHIPEIIREAGEQGAHVRHIGEKTCQDPAKIARLLRLLATNYIFREVAPDVFAHNRISIQMDTGKPFAELKCNPLEKYMNTNGMAAMIAHSTDEVAKASSYLAETLKDPATALSYDPTKAPFSRGLNTTDGFFDWLERPWNEPRLRRFGPAMGAAQVAPPEAALQGFDWGSLPKDALVVDVGGGVGTVTSVLVKALPDLKFVIQDRQAVIEDGIKIWQKEHPGYIQNGQVQFQVQDFFKPQPEETKGAALFFMRFILHDWPHEFCVTIMRHLRAAAGPDTKLLVSDHVLSYACTIKEGETEFANIPGAILPPVPQPLLPNLGRGGAGTYYMDYQMLVMFNSQERTVGEFQRLGEETGWKLTSVKRGLHSYVLFSPM